MSSMHTPPTTVEPFAVVRKGFDREQVTAALSRLEAEAELLRADRDAAVARADRAAAEAVCPPLSSTSTRTPLPASRNARASPTGPDPTTVTAAPKAARLSKSERSAIIPGSSGRVSGRFFACAATRVSPLRTGPRPGPGAFRAPLPLPNTLHTKRHQPGVANRQSPADR